MSNLKNKVIITAALTGALTPKGYKIPGQEAAAAFADFKEKHR